MKYFILLVVFLSLVIFLHGGESYDGAIVHIEHLYATSIQMPHAKYSPYNLFDGNTNSYWQTMKGAGPDEGVFIKFRVPTYITKLSIPVPNKRYRKFLWFKLYINGTESSIYSSYSSPITINRKVKTLYLRVVDKGRKFWRYNKIRIRELTFFGSRNQRLKLVPPKSVSGKIIASSTLDPKEAYNVDFLFDSRVDFGWADGHPRKTGVGEKLCFDFDKKVTIDKIKLWNGYLRSNRHYSANERVRNFSFGLKGSKGQLYHIRDRKISYIKLKKPLTGKSFVFNVSRVYRGSKYRDLVISEMRFYNGKKSFIMKTGNVERRKKKLIAIAKLGSQWGWSRLLDRRLKTSDNRFNRKLKQSLILRSNGSFVLWFFEETPSKIVIRYADGNWKRGHRLKLFGKIHTITKYRADTYYDPYAGRQTVDNTVKDANTTRIFSDTLLISPSKVKSKKGLFRAFTKERY